MKITVFDIGAIGTDIDISPITALGDCEVFTSTARSEVISRISDTEVAVLNKIKMTAEVLKNAPKLKLICVAATGFDNIDTEYCFEHGIAVCNVPAYSTDSVALITVALASNLAAKIQTYSDFVKSGEYTLSGCPNRLTPAFNDFSDKTWGIVGYGNIGKKVADVARAFGCRVIYTKNTPDENSTDIDTLCAESDIISLHCPLTDKTRGIIDEKRLSLMKSSAVLVNVARGAVCDENAVAEAVLNGKIAAFGCDVYSAEPFGTDHPYNKIKELPNVCLTPHIAWASVEARTRVIQEMADNIKAFYAGETRNRVERRR